MKFPRPGELLPFVRDVLVGAAMVRINDPRTHAEMIRRLHAASRAYDAIREVIDHKSDKGEQQ